MRAVMPGCHGTRAQRRADLLNAFEELEAERAALIADQVDADHNLPAVIWWVVVCIASVISLGVGIALGSGQ